jgi:hypothetical protein
MRTLPPGGGRHPPARTGGRNIKHSNQANGQAAGRDARLYGRQDACRYGAGRWPRVNAPTARAKNVHSLTPIPKAIKFTASQRKETE